jgi:hypothetical protein
MRVKTLALKNNNKELDEHIFKYTSPVLLCNFNL